MVVKFHSQFWDSEILKLPVLDPSGKGNCLHYDFGFADIFLTNPQYFCEEYNKIYKDKFKLNLC